MKKINLLFLSLAIFASCDNQDEFKNEDNQTDSKLQSYIEIAQTAKSLESFKNVCKTELDYKLAKEAIDITGRYDLQETAFPFDDLKVIDFENKGLQLRTKGDLLIYQGDIILTPEQARVLSDNNLDIPALEFSADSLPPELPADFDPSQQSSLKSAGVLYYLGRYLWPRSKDNLYHVYYTIHPEMSTRTRQMVTSAMTHWEANTNVRFHVKTTGSDYIEFFNGDGCWSNVGRIGGKQQLSLDDSWAQTGNAIHEIGHAVGFFHEQCKPKRDDFINVHYDNIQSGTNNTNYQKRGVNTLASKGFDFESVMLYSSRNSDAINSSRPVMTRKDGTEWTGQRRGLSEGDIYLLPWMYYYAYLTPFLK